MTTAPNDKPSAGERLRGLLRQALDGALDVGAFCDSFERAYNLEIDKGELTERERAAVKTLFERIVWYSPCEAEQRSIPNYIGEQEVVEAVRAAGETLGL